MQHYRHDCKEHQQRGKMHSNALNIIMQQVMGSCCSEHSCNCMPVSNHATEQGANVAGLTAVERFRQSSAYRYTNLQQLFVL